MLMLVAATSTSGRVPVTTVVPLMPIVAPNTKQAAG
jgi:hypothetical protein